jgi:two-component system alkaline phosphatase synthesis response regulator PhoP
MTNNHNPSNSYRSILIVEDSHPQALKLKMALENNGCHVDWADTGLGGLNLAQEKKFDLIVLDIELPDINGFEVCKRLKTDLDLQDTPVVMLTTLDHAEHVVNGLEAGAIDYIPKDAFAEVVLMETIKQMS